MTATTSPSRSASAAARQARLVDAREKRIPAVIDFPDALPVSARRDDLARLIADHPVLIVAGATGSGKTTQLPKIALAMGRGRAGHIGVTQPRRLAATTVAARVAQELGTPPGETVGHQIRFETRVDPATPVKFMTDGILLAEIRRDPDLSAYDTLILDEAHERGLNVDFLLGYVKRLLPRRPDLRVVVSSATLAVDRFAEFFDGAPVVEVEGRVYPIETRYRPPLDENGDEHDDPDLPALVRAACDELAYDLPQGDVLVFLAGEADIRAVAEALERDNPHDDAILPLFARLPWEQQRRVFAPAPRRKIILSTNVAETSLTIPGVRAVVDAGLARVRRASERTAVERLRIEPVSRASADQRRGRCGRVGPGICIRLYSEDAYLRRPEYTDPEIRRAGLAGVILQMKTLALGPIEDFPFIDPPRAPAVTEGYRTLLEIGALDARRELTDIGRRLAHFPLEPRLARILTAAAPLGVADEALAVAAFLSIQDPRERPAEKRGEADAAHRALSAHARSDFVGVLALWDAYHDARADAPSKSALRRWCRAHFLNFLRMEEWRDIHRQLAGHLRHAPRTRGLYAADWSGLRPRADDPVPDRYAALHQALLAGFLGRIGRRDDPPPPPAPGRTGATPSPFSPTPRAAPGEYQGTRGIRFRLWPGSGVAALARVRRARDPFGRGGKNPLPVVDAHGRAPSDPAAEAAASTSSGGWPDWVVGAELIETTRTYARMAAEVEPAWIEKAAGWLAKRSYARPAYDENTGFVRALERVRVQGLTVADARPVHYGPVDPVDARRIFIREALVEGRLKTRPAFFVHNRRLAEDIENDAHKARRTGGVDPERLFDLYDARLPASICHDRALRQWLAEREKDDPRALFFSVDDFAMGDRGGLSPTRFPSAVFFAGRRYPVAYRFAPGDDDDGVTWTVPAADLGAIPPWRLDWLVPGWLGEKIAHALRALPKGIRRAFVPIPDSVDAALDALGQEPFAPTEPFFARLAKTLSSIGGVSVDAATLAATVFPSHLCVNLRVVDADGAVLAEGRDLAALRERLRGNADAMFRDLSKSAHEKTGLTGWTFDDWPVSVPLPGALAFPALVDEGRTVALRLCRTEAEAALRSHGGLMRLFALALAQPIAKTRAALPLSSATLLRVAASDYAPDALRDDLLAGALAEAFVDDKPFPRTREAFFERVEAGRAAFTRGAHESARAFDTAWKSAVELFERISGLPESLSDAREDLVAVVRGLLARGAVLDGSPRYWVAWPRYFEAVEKRLERLAWASAKDRERRNTIAPFDERWRRARSQRMAEDAAPWTREAVLAWRRYRWMVEDWRAALFAPELGGGRGGASPARLDRAWTAFLDARRAGDGVGGRS